MNVIVGFGINFAANMVILPLFGMPFSVASFVGIGMLYTVISVVRSYFLRRGFNWIHVTYFHNL